MYIWVRHLIKEILIINWTIPGMLHIVTSFSLKKANKSDSEMFPATQIHCRMADVKLHHASIEL